MMYTADVATMISLFNDMASSWVGSADDSESAYWEALDSFITSEGVMVAQNSYDQDLDELF